MRIKFFSIIILFLFLMSCSNSDNRNFIINKKEYKNKLEGFWLGQSIANWTGIKNGNWIFKKLPTRYTKDYVDEPPDVEPPEID